MALHRLVRVLAALLLVAALPAAATADGKVFTRYATAAPTPIPDQQAIIVYDAAKQVQTLAIETRFIPPPPPASPAGAEKLPTDAAPFAWVVPLPGPDPPTIRPATTGLFPTVRAVFQPRVIDSGEGMAGTLLLFVFMTLLGVLVCMIQKQNMVVAILFGLVIGFVLCGVLLPTLGTARSSRGGSDALVNVLQRSIVGSYDVAVIGASDSVADKSAEAATRIAAWLKDNGFQMPAGIEPVLDQYAARQWVFAACKLRDAPNSAGAAPLAPHPLIFTFKTAQCVYPLELTGVGNGPLSVDLYAFSNQRASATGFDEIRCEQLDSEAFVAGDYSRRGPARGIVITHSLLRELVSGATVATKLSGTLSTAQQQSDAYLAWHAPRDSGGVKYSRVGATGRATDLAAAALLIGVIALVVIAAARRQHGSWVFKKLAWPLVVALMIGGGVYAALPKVEITEIRGRRAWRIADMHEDVAALAGKSLSAAVTGLDGSAAGSVSLEQARAEVVRAWTARKREDVPLPREEDSPWNYTVTQDSTDGPISYIWYDASGTPQRAPLWPAKSRTRP